MGSIRINIRLVCLVLCKEISEQTKGAMLLHSDPKQRGAIARSTGFLGAAKHKATPYK